MAKRYFYMIIIAVFFCLPVCLVVAQAEEGEVSAEEKSKIEAALKSFQEVLQNNFKISDTEVFQRLEDYLNKNPFVYGATFAFEPGQKDGSMVYRAPYVFRKDGKVIQKQLEPGTDYTKEEWYVISAKQAVGGWSKPYYDALGAGSDIYMATYSLPVYDKDSHLVGVITSDVLLSK